LLASDLTEPARKIPVQFDLNKQAVRLRLKWYGNNGIVNGYPQEIVRLESLAERRIAHFAAE